MIGLYDAVTIVFYFLLLLGIGVYFAQRNRNTSDFFRGGGALPGWLAGASAWMGSFSAWTFTGAAGKMYLAGPYVFGLFYSAVIPLLVLLTVTSVRFRRMGVVTPLEAVRLRYGAGAQQFFAWMRLPFMFLLGGITLNAVGVFMAAVFGVPLPAVIVGVGVAVTLVALMGGSFGLVVSDFVQMLLVLAITGTVAVRALALPDIGGWAGMWRQAPAPHHDWSALARPELIVAWVVALTITKLFESNGMEASAKYLMARNERQARLTPLIPLLGTLLAPLVWLVPPTVAAIRHPDLAAQFPALKFPQEAAFLATAAEVLPQGMMGLLVCGLFATTLANLYADLNLGVGVFVRNFYLPILHPEADERRLLVVCRMATGFFGGLVIALGLLVNGLRESNLFDLLNQLAVSLAIPLAAPLFFGLYFKRTPAWSAWSTVMVGLACSLAVKLFFRPEMLGGWPGLGGPLLPEERTQLILIVTVLSVTLVCTVWYFLTSLFYSRTSAQYRAAVDAFFARLKTRAVETGPDEPSGPSDLLVMIRRLCLLFGTGIAVLALIPNPWSDRLCFLACGGAMGAVGALLGWRRQNR